jgi:hypothetical protein
MDTPLHIMAVNTTANVMSRIVSARLSLFVDNASEILMRKAPLAAQSFAL